MCVCVFGGGARCVRILLCVREACRHEGGRCSHLHAGQCGEALGSLSSWCCSQLTERLPGSTHVSLHVSLHVSCMCPCMRPCMHACTDCRAGTCRGSATCTWCERASSTAARETRQTGAWWGHVFLLCREVWCVARRASAGAVTLSLLPVDVDSTFAAPSVIGVLWLACLRCVCTCRRFKKYLSNLASLLEQVRWLHRVCVPGSECAVNESTQQVPRPACRVLSHHTMHTRTRTEPNNTPAHTTPQRTHRVSRVTSLTHVA
jgi:hypothetical protein